MTSLVPGPYLSLLQEAHRLAVADGAEMLEGRAAWARHAGQRVPCGVVAASFEHISSNSGDPHVHDHLVLANLGLRADGGWSCLDARELWHWREAVGAGFQLALRSRLNEAGLGLHWELATGGVGEIASVPVETLRSASSRSRAVLARGRTFGSVTAAAGRAAQGMTRKALPAPVVLAGGERRSGDGDQALATGVVRAALATPAAPAPPPSPELVAEALTARASSFGEPDVLVALAETSPRGRDLRGAMTWSRDWCRTNPRADRTGTELAAARRWTTLLARALDKHVVDAVTEAARCPLGAGQPRPRRTRARGARRPRPARCRRPPSRLRQRRCCRAAKGTLALTGSVHRRGACRLAGGWCDRRSHLPHAALGTALARPDSATSAGHWHLWPGADRARGTGSSWSTRPTT